MADLDALISDQLADGRATWPEINVDADRYLRQLAASVDRRSAESAERVVRTIPAADLYLAAACASGDERAIRALHQAYWPPVREVLVRLGASAAVLSDTEQQLLAMLFVPAAGGRPQIANYSGRGRLHSWFRSIGVRTGRRLMGVGAEHREDLHDLPALIADPQLEIFRRQYEGKFRAALVTALGELTRRQRNLLRQYHIDGLTIDQLGRLYHVNRATAARWLIAARQAVLAATRARLAAELAIHIDEVDSIIRLVRSRMDVTLRDLLA